MHTYMRKLLAACLVLSAVTAVAGTPVFVQDGHLTTFSGGVSRTLGIREASAIAETTASRVSAYWGSLADARLVVTLEPAVQAAAADTDPHCSTRSEERRAVLLRSDGTLDSELGADVLRAFPGPVGASVALISPQRDLSIWQDGRQTTVTAPGRISNVGWSPDGRYLAVSAYPSDWTEGAVSSARTAADFLRLQNADIYLFDTEKMAFVGRLTDDPGTEYGPFFSPDGRSLYYVWLHATEDRGGLMRLDLDRDGGTSATKQAIQLTQAGNDPGETPLGRVGTHIWLRSGTQLVFESGLPDGSGEIWTMSPDGRGAARLAAGRKPQPVNGAGVTFLNDKGIPESVVPEVRR